MFARSPEVSPGVDEALDDYPAIHMQLHLAVSRRLACALLAPLASMPLVARPSPAHAFQNALPLPPGVGDPPPKKTPGPQPTGLGYRAAAGSGPGAAPSDLKPCLDGRPHCFSSSRAVTAAGDNTKLGSDWLVKPWKYTDKSQLQALDDIKTAVDAYQVGQNGIDGGGFKVVTFRLPEQAELDVGYLYVQFESLVMGYIDDMEFVVAPGGLVNVRTSSRAGYLDFGGAPRAHAHAARALTKPLSDLHAPFLDRSQRQALQLVRAAARAGQGLEHDAREGARASRLLRAERRLGRRRGWQVRGGLAACSVFSLSASQRDKHKLCDSGPN